MLVAAVIGAFTVHALIGPEPAFQLPRIEEPSWRVYLLMPLVAVIAALIGVGFQRTTLALRSSMQKGQLADGQHPPGFGSGHYMGSGTAAFSVTGKLGVFGIGYDDLSHALQDGFVWQAAGFF